MDLEFIDGLECMPLLWYGFSTCMTHCEYTIETDRTHRICSPGINAPELSSEETLVETFIASDERLFKTFSSTSNSMAFDARETEI